MISGRSLHLRDLVCFTRSAGRGLLGVTAVPLGLRESRRFAKLFEGRRVDGFEREDLLVAELEKVSEALHAGVDQPLDPLGVDTVGLEAAQLLDHPRHAGHLDLDLAPLLFFALDVDAPADELGRQADVLSLLADGEAELLVLDDDLHDPLFLVGHGDAADDRGRERLLDELDRILAPLDDVDLLSPQLADDRLDPGSLHADAGTDRIDVALAGDDCHLGPLPRLTHAAPDLDGAVVDLRDLHLEELHEEGRIGAADDDVGALGGLGDANDRDANPVAGLVGLGAALLLAREQRLGPPEVDDAVTHLLAFDDPVDDLADASRVLGEDVVAFGLAHLLEDHLLGRLCSDAPEHVRRLGELDLRPEFGLVDELAGVRETDLRLGDLHLLDHMLHSEDLDLTRVLVEAATQILGRLVVLLGGREDRVLDGGNDDIRVDVLLATDLLDLLTELVGHGPLRSG